MKMKGKKALKGRIKLTCNGKVMHFKPGHRHFLTKKSSKRKRSMKGNIELAPPMAKKYKALMLS